MQNEVTSSHTFKTLKSFKKKKKKGNLLAVLKCPTETTSSVKQYLTASFSSCWLIDNGMAQPSSPWQQHWELSEENCTWHCRPSSSHASASSGGCFLCKSGMLQGTINPVRRRDYRSRGDFTEPRSSAVTPVTNLSTRFTYWNCSAEWSRSLGGKATSKLMMHDKVWHAQWRMEKAVGLGRLPFPPLYPTLLCARLSFVNLGAQVSLDVSPRRRALHAAAARKTLLERTNSFLKFPIQHTLPGAQAQGLK